MKRARVVIVVAVLSGLAGCGPSGPPTQSPTQPTSESTGSTAVTPARAEPGGCGDTPLWRDGEPDWIASAGGVGRLPYALSHEGNLFAALFAQPLRAGEATNPYNKILWIAREPREGKSLKLTMRRVDGTGPVVTQEQAANSWPGEIYPSTVDVPSAGCWTVTAEWAGHRATLELAWV